MWISRAGGGGMEWDHPILTHIDSVLWEYVEGIECRMSGRVTRIIGAILLINLNEMWFGLSCFHLSHNQN
jgi:hypothetical protein